VLDERRGMFPDRPRHQGIEPHLDPVVQLEHLLKVAGSVCLDANQTWAELWAQIKQAQNGSGQGEHGSSFTPECGWPAFVEKFWLLKHYMDSVQRICSKQ
jgi:hypothetical protein